MRRVRCTQPPAELGPHVAPAPAPAATSHTPAACSHALSTHPAQHTQRMLQEADQLKEKVEETQEEVAARERAAAALETQLDEQRRSADKAVRAEQARVVQAERAGAETAAELADRQRLNEALQVRPPPPSPPNSWNP